MPAALATAALALTGADSAAGGGEPRVAKAGAGSGASAVERVTDATRAAISVAAAARRRATRAPAFAIVTVAPGKSVALRSRPGGPVALRVADTTDFGSPQRLGVVQRRGRWLGVTTPALDNGTLGWIDRRAAGARIDRTRWSIHADVSSRTIVLRRAGRTVRRLDVAVGRPDTPTPTGRFAVTDKLSGGDFGAYYGCCILAISATQPNLAPGWTGGDRMAIHGTSDPSSIGAAASAGCLRAADGDLSFLMARVPVGTPVVIRR